MRTKRFVSFIAVALLSTVAVDSQAASISFDLSSGITVSGGQLSVTVYYDFTDRPIIAGGFNLLYDPSAVEFVSFSLATFSGVGSPQNSVSLPGFLDSPGNYLSVIIGTGDFFNGISTAGEVGTFVFNIIAFGENTVCGALMCLTPDPSVPFTLRDGPASEADITDEVFANGVTELPYSAIPVPAAIWFFASGLAFLVGVGRSRALAK